MTWWVMWRKLGRVARPNGKTINWSGFICETHLWVLCCWDYYIMSEIHGSPQLPINMTGFSFQLHIDQKEIVCTYIFLFTISTMFTVFTIFTSFNLHLVILNINVYFLYSLFYLPSSVFCPEPILNILSLV